MPFIRSLVFKRTAYYFKLVAVILLLNKIIPTYSYYIEKGLVYITIIALLGRQPSSYIKYTKLNIRSSYNIKSVSNTKYTFLIHSYILQSLRLPYLICLKVLYNGYYKETQFRALSCLK